jgi:tetratricopeptide (TPR) repeat protein
MIGRGGFGAVYEGIDGLTQQAVAIKLMGDSYGKELTHQWREAALLRLLQLPGVVQLIEEGSEGGTTYLVMELVEGRPFPGDEARGDWSKIEGPLRRLLETLERVHLEGIVHRDLKPHNVLVKEDGSVVLLDFGLSLDPNLTAPLTSTPSRIVGTPAYLAPEQWRSEPVSRQTDLWAVGIMLFEALTGKLPFTSGSMLEMMREALSGEVRLAALPPEVPPHVVWLVRRLLSSEASARPVSAGDALRLLDGVGSAQSRQQLPLLGRGAALEETLRHLRAGESVGFSGPRGSGRTRMLQEVREALGREGRFTLRLWPADEPLHSLRELMPRTGEEAEREALEQLRDALAGRMVLLAEDLETLDPVTRGVISKHLPDYPILCGRARGATLAHEVALAPIGEDVLYNLFGGHEKILRMRSGGAQELWRRTGGNAGQIVREVEGWVRAKMARWHGELLVLEHDALPRLRAGLQLTEADIPRPEDSLEERIQSWLFLTQPEADPAMLSSLLHTSQQAVEEHISQLAAQGHIQRDAQGKVFVQRAAWMDEVLPADVRRDAHQSIAASLPQGHPRRLYHMVAAGEQSSLVDELLAQALRWDAQGFVSRALVTLSDGVRQARAQRPPLDETPLLLAASRIALESGSRRELERLLYELEATRHPTPLAETCAQLVNIALTVMQRGGQAELDAINAIFPIFQDDILELRRCQWRMAATRDLPLSTAEAELEDIRDWAESTNNADILGTYLGWLGILRYRGHRFEEAAQLHRRAASLKTRVLGRIGSLFNAMLAYENEFMLDEALYHADLIFDTARNHELFEYELFATLSRQNIQYRMGDISVPDPELLDLADRINDQRPGQSHLLIAAAIHARRGEREQALAYAQRLLTRASDANKTVLVLSHALHCALIGEPPSVTTLLFKEILALPKPRIMAQALGLLAMCMKLPEEAQAVLASLSTSVPPEHLHTRLEVLSIAESLAHAGLMDGPRAF